MRGGPIRGTTPGRPAIGIAVGVARVSRQPFEESGAIAQAWGGDAHPVEHRQPEVVDGRFLGVADMTARLEGPAPAAGDQDRDILVRVAVAVAVAAAVSDHAVVE